MAEELQWSFLWSYENGNISESKSWLGQLIDCTYEGMQHGVQNFTTEALVTLNLGALTNPGLHILRNVSADKTTGLIVGFTDISSIKLVAPTDSKRGGLAVFTYFGGTIKLKNDAPGVTGSVEYWVFPL